MPNRTLLVHSFSFYKNIFYKNIKAEICKILINAGLRLVLKRIEFLCVENLKMQYNYMSKTAKLASKAIKICTRQMFDANDSSMNGTCNTHVWFPHGIQI